MYELDATARRVRRICGDTQPTPRQGDDGEWRTFESVFPTPIALGESVLFIWGYYQRGTESVARSTMTSIVVGTVDAAGVTTGLVHRPGAGADAERH
jgi:hypothetical protein